MAVERKVFEVNRGINRPIEFRGLKGQYIGYFAACAVGILVMFGVFYACGISLYICTPLALGLGGIVTMWIFRLSGRYGLDGLMKHKARRRLPVAFLTRSRKVFIQIRNDYVRTIR